MRAGCLGFVVAGAIGVSLAAAPQTRGAVADGDADVSAISALVDRFVQAANAGEIAMAGDVWLQSGDVSMITPHGHYVGWEAIKRDYYTVQLFGATSRRILTVDNLVVHSFGDTAVAEFTWVFDATLRANAAEVHAAGWETQVFNRMRDGRWKLVHVHYSAAPAQ